MSAGELLVWAVWIVAVSGLFASGLAVIGFENPFYSALALIVNLGSLAVLYLLLTAEFVAAAQVLVYAGAVVVMFLFVIAYLGGKADSPWSGKASLHSLAALAATAAIATEIVLVLALQAGDRLTRPAAIGASFGSPAEIGKLFLADYLLAFEATSIILLVAAVGGVVLGQSLPKEERTGE